LHISSAGFQSSRLSNLKESAMAKPTDTERTRWAVDETQAEGTPKRGDTYHCDMCGTELEITADCGCSDPQAVHFQCCGQEMARA
jgi:hypothetical protein